MTSSAIKKVVFITGTAFSGSTMLDMMLGNTDSAFSMGEVKFLFKPTKKFHVNPVCGCTNTICDIWPNLKKYGPHLFYAGLFERYGNITTIVDSSKDLFWIKEQIASLQKMKIDCKIILIYKTPLEFALSRFKRNSLEGWEGAWIRYHKLLISLFDDWSSVRYQDLAKRPSDTLSRICDRFQLEFNAGMENYWRKTHHLLFGNLSAKYHTIEKRDDSYQKIVSHLTSIEETVEHEKMNIDASYRSIEYSVKGLASLPQSVIQKSEKSIFSDIMDYVSAKDVFIDKLEILPSSHNKCVFPWPIVSLFYLKSFLTSEFYKLKYRKDISTI